MEIRTWIWGTGNAWPELFPHRDRPRGNTSVSLTGHDETGVPLHLVVDTGAGCSQGIRDAALPTPDVILLTHTDPDHLNRMEIDTLIRMAKLEKRPQLRVVATETTWNQIHPFDRSRLEWIAATPGMASRIDVRGHEIEVLPVSAQDHRPGGVVFVISAEGFRFGALFDKKYWSNIRDEVEDLDLAIMEANSKTRLAHETGHVSLLDDIELLRRLRKPPRMTIFTHYGTDDSEVLSVGSLSVSLPALAPGIACCWAHPGMMISSRALPPRNPIALIDADNHLLGVEDKSAVHARGLLHASVMTLVRYADSRLAVYERHDGQSYAGCLDLLASGHMEPRDFPDPLCAAKREADEELALWKDGFRVLVDSAWITPLTPPFSVVSPDPVHNNERSSVFGLWLPGGVEIRGSDITDAGEVVEIKVRALTLAELLEQHHRDPSKLADGLRRVLAEFLANAEFRTSVNSFLESA